MVDQCADIASVRRRTCPVSGGQPGKIEEKQDLRTKSACQRILTLAGGRPLRTGPAGSFRSDALGLERLLDPVHGRIGPLEHCLEGLVGFAVKNGDCAGHDNFSVLAVLLHLFLEFG